MYRDLHFSASQRGLEREEQLRNRLCLRQDLALHVRSVLLDITKTKYASERPFEKPFETRIKLVLQPLRNLRRVELHTRTWKKSQQCLVAVLSILNDMKHRPEIEFDLRDNIATDAVTDDDIYDRGDVILRINDRLRITSLSISTRWTLVKLQFLSQLPYLNTLSLYGRFATTEGVGWADLDTIFNDSPLTNFRISNPYLIYSLPSNLRYLKLDEGFSYRYSLDFITWNAVCRLQGLTELELDFSNVDEWNTKCEFLSNLRSFKALLRDSPALQRQILRPIFSRSSRLASIKFIVIRGPLSSNIIKCLVSANPTLSSLDVETCNPTPYKFQDLIEESTISSNLTRLKLPWPASIGNEIMRPPTQSNFLRHGECRDGIPEQLTFQVCQRLAETCPRLDRIEFDINSQNMATTWSRYWLRRNRAPRMPLQSEKLGEWWATYLERLQSLKMSKFIDILSPCLNLCTLLFYFEDPDFIQQTASHRFSREIVIILSLNQIRKHVGL